jgi:hypothetical protein
MQRMTAIRPYLQNVHGAAYGQLLLFTTTASGPQLPFVGRAAKVGKEPLLIDAAGGTNVCSALRMHQVAVQYVFARCPAKLAGIIPTEVCRTFIPDLISRRRNGVLPTLQQLARGDHPQVLLKLQWGGSRY